MANINSQKKRIRQDKKRNLRNKSIKTELKSVLKSVEDSSYFMSFSVCYRINHVIEIRFSRYWPTSRYFFCGQ